MQFLNASKIYPQTRAGLAELTTEFKLGAWTTLLGQSGSGKSTLLKLVAGLEEPSSGKIENPFHQNETSFVFQEPALLPWKTVMENVALPLTLKGESISSAASAAEPWLQKLKLSQFAHAYPRELSGGMKMRVSLARALVTKPNLLLLDEPFSALDEPIRIELGLELRELWKTLKPTILMVTHSITEALWLSDRVLVFRGQPGKKIWDEDLPYGAERPLSLRGLPDFQKKVGECFELLRDSSP